MPPTVKVKDQKTGEMVDGEVIKVVHANEPFSHVTLEDGTEITMRTTVLQIVRILNKWDEQGNPVYSIDAAGSVSINSPDHLKKAESDGS